MLPATFKTNPHDARGWLAGASFPARTVGAECAAARIGGRQPSSLFGASPYGNSSGGRFSAALRGAAAAAFAFERSRARAHASSTALMRLRLRRYATAEGRPARRRTGPRTFAAARFIYFLFPRGFTSFSVLFYFFLFLSPTFVLSLLISPRRSAFSCSPAQEVSVTPCCYVK